MNIFGFKLKNINVEKFTFRAVVITALIISISSFLYYLKANYILIYADAASHLNISRRVMDGLTPGFSQLGSVWLPLPHLLTLPFIWNNYLWRSGFAGSIISMISYILTIILIYKTAKLFTNSKLAGFTAAMVTALNANLVYLQATPMTEPLSLALNSAFLYFLLKWQRTKSILFLISAAFFVLLATLTRYESWFLLVFATIFVLWTSWIRNKRKEVESNLVLFSTLAFFGIILWFLYNQIILGDYLYFLRGEYSAQAQQNILEQIGRLPTKHNLVLSIRTYVWTLVDILGVAGAGMAILSLFSYIYSRENRKDLPYLLVMMGPLTVTILTLYLGITAIYVPQISTSHVIKETFNLRYGLISLPFMAISSALIVKRIPKLAIFILVVVLLQNIYLFKTNNVIVLNDALTGASSVTKDSREIASALQANCNNKLTILSAANFDPIFLKSNIDLKYFISEGTGAYWNKSLIDPTEYANCVVMAANDKYKDYVRMSLLNNSDFNKNYHIILQNDLGIVYKINTRMDELETVSAPKTSCDYSVEAGDSLWSIAENKLASGYEYPKIVDLNKEINLNVNLISPAQKLIIPCSPSA